MYIEWMNELIGKLKWYDISFVEAAVFFGTLFLLSVWPAFLEVAMRVHWGWYLGLMALFCAPIWRKMF